VKNLTRRNFVRGAVGTTLAAPLAPAFIRRAAAAGEVVHMSWGGLSEENMYKAFFNTFQQETDIKITAISPLSLARVAAAAKAGKMDIDSFDAGTIEIYRGQRQGLLSPIDWSVVKKEGRSKEEIHEYGLRFMALSNQIVYNTTKYPAGKGPASLADFWDVKKFPGRRSLYKDPRTAIQFALLADGVPRDKLYPLDLNRAFKSLDRIKPHVAVWWEQGNQSQQLFTTGEVDIMQLWNGRATDLERKGAPIHQVWNDAIITLSGIMVTKGAPNLAGTMRLVEVFGRPKPQAEWAKLMTYGPLNKKAFEFIDADTARRLPTYPENFKGQVISDDDWWGANWDSVNERFKGWLAS